MGFDYYIVLGGYLDPYQYLQTSIELIRRRFSILGMSKFYVGPSEETSITHQFMNVAIHIHTTVSIEALTKNLIEIENAQQNKQKKIIDIDLLLQIKDGCVLYYSSKLSRYCHCLVTLKDLCPELMISGKSISTNFKLNESKEFFSIVK